ncbi:hypothetical protein PspLS_01954 [Pyricularia sp. CBS 133598]|nr:hypothetical protein PspLS_01954 [Pyricularia sp. CBS 133598]
MSLSQNLTRPVPTLARWNRPVLHRCLHQPSDPRQSGSQQKSDEAPDAQKDPTQGPTDTRQDPRQATDSGNSNAFSQRPKDYKTRLWIRGMIAGGLRAPPADKGGLEELKKMFQKKKPANLQGRRPALFIGNKFGGQSTSVQARKDAMDKLLREKYGIEDPEKRKSIIENSRTIEVDLNNLKGLWYLIEFCFYAAGIYLLLNMLDREKQTAIRQEQIETEIPGTDGQYPMMEDNTKLSDI